MAMSEDPLRATHAFIESRPWFPRYRATLTNSKGVTVAVKQFWRLRSAQDFGFCWNEVLDICKSVPHA